MTKDECEQAQRQLYSLWKKELSPDELVHPSWNGFKRWAEGKGYGHYFKFRSVMGADYDGEQWFDSYFKLTWMR